MKNIATNLNPIAGKRILITRPKGYGTNLSDLLRKRHALPIEVPMIEIDSLKNFELLDNRLSNIKSYDWLILGSIHVVEAITNRLNRLSIDFKCLEEIKIATVGSATTKSLNICGIKSDFLTTYKGSESIVKSFKYQNITGQRILIPSSDIGGHNLEKGLSFKGNIVERIDAYRNLIPKSAPRELTNAFQKGIDIIILTSASTATNLYSILGKDTKKLAGVAIVCLGQVTASAAQKLGLVVNLVAKEHNMESLVEVLESNYCGVNK
jgi:uroporphyrinogen-III synthase